MGQQEAIEFLIDQLRSQSTHWPDPTQSCGQFAQNASLRETRKQMQGHDQRAHLHHVRLAFSLLPGVGLLQDLAEQGNGIQVLEDVKKGLLNDLVVGKHLA